jgi:hypothetical protein
VPFASGAQDGRAYSDASSVRSTSVVAKVLEAESWT